MIRASCDMSVVDAELVDPPLALVAVTARRKRAAERLLTDSRLMPEQVGRTRAQAATKPEKLVDPRRGSEAIESNGGAHEVGVGPRGPSHHVLRNSPRASSSLDRVAGVDRFGVEAGDKLVVEVRGPVRVTASVA